MNIDNIIIDFFKFIKINESSFEHYQQKKEFLNQAMKHTANSNDSASRWAHSKLANASNNLDYNFANDRS